MTSRRSDRQIAEVIKRYLTDNLSRWGIDGPFDVAVGYQPERFGYYVRAYFGSLEPRVVVDWLIDDSDIKNGIDAWFEAELLERLVISDAIPIAEPL